MPLFFFVSVLISASSEYQCIWVLGTSVKSKQLYPTFAVNMGIFIEFIFSMGHILNYHRLSGGWGSHSEGDKQMQHTQISLCALSTTVNSSPPIV